jgi:S-adenosylmethionine hydrolase
MAIFLFTDFGARDLYVGQVRAALQREAPGLSVIDLFNDVPPFNVRAAAHLLAALAPVCPPGSVILAVVDPGVGSKRDAVALHADGRWYVGPDNGLLSVVGSRTAHPIVSRIVWEPARLSASFHGRDLFAPVAARIAAGKVPDDWLESRPGLEFDFGAEDLGEVIYVDHYGNAMTGIRAAGVSREARFVVGGESIRHARVFSDAPSGTPFWYENSQGLIEIAVNLGSAAATLRVDVGELVGWTN